MLKLARRARGHFVTIIEILVHLIRVKPGHISCFDNCTFKFESAKIKMTACRFVLKVTTVL